jgi:hypothetical protein
VPYGTDHLQKHFPERYALLVKLALANVMEFGFHEAAEFGSQEAGGLEDLVDVAMYTMIVVGQALMLFESEAYGNRMADLMIWQPHVIGKGLLTLHSSTLRLNVR